MKKTQARNIIDKLTQIFVHGRNFPLIQRYHGMELHDIDIIQGLDHSNLINNNVIKVIFGDRHQIIRLSKGKPRDIIQLYSD